MISTQTLFHRLVATLLVFVATLSSALADDSGTGWAYESKTNTLTLSGSEVDWTAIKDFSATTKNVVFADDFSVSSIPSVAFRKFSELTAIDIPSVVTSIGTAAFERCSSLASVTFPDGLTEIGLHIFFYCSSLASVTFPDGLSSIGGYAFCGCTSLASITLPEGVENIDEAAFESCTSLASVSLPGGLTSIGRFAFEKCSSLASITLPEGLTSIGEGAFYGCTSLNSVEILSNGTSDNKHVIYLDGSAEDKTSISKGDVFPLHQATLIYDPNTTWIGDDDTQNLRYYFNKFLSKGTGWSYDYETNTLTLSGSEVDWTAIKDFSTTTKNVVFADDYSVSLIPSEAFKGFSELTAIDIPSVVTSIGNSAFYGCAALASVSLPDGLKSIGSYAFDNCTSLTSISLPDGLTSIGAVVFAQCSSLTSITLPDGISSIGRLAFYNCTALASITLPDGVKEIEGAAFEGCSSLASVSLPATLTSIGDDAFGGCSSLKSVEILSNGTSDNKHVIYLGGSKDKTSNGTQVFPLHQATLTYDPNTTWIGDDDSQNLRYYFNKFLSQGTGWSYDYETNTLTLSGSEVDWTAIKDFSTTTKNVVFADDYSVSLIPSEAFKGFSELTAIDIPSVVTSIGNSAFSGCTSLASVSLPDGLTSIGDYAFYKCASLASISLPEGLTSIGDSAFYNCSSLSSVTLPEGLTSIGRYAFDGCASLASITLPEGVENIDGGAFNGCTSLSSVTLPATLTSIGSGAFDGCSSLKSVEILSNGTSDNKHVIYLGGSTDKTSNGTQVFPIHQATLTYDPNTTWIGDDDTQNLRYYFNKFSNPTSIHSNTISNSAPRYYDLSGRPVNPTSHKGIAVKLQDGHSSLTTIK